MELRKMDKICVSWGRKGIDRTRVYRLIADASAVVEEER
jgi:hypothetical protein